MIRALFELDEEDRTALAEVPDADDLRQLWVVRLASETKWRLERGPNRDLTSRRGLASVLDTVTDDSGVARAIEDVDHPLSTDLIESARSLANSDTDSLTEQERSVFTDLAGAIEGVVEEPGVKPTEDVQVAEGEVADSGVKATDLEARVEVARTLRNVAAEESKPSPWQQAVNILKERIPTFVQFNEEDRDLQSEYDLNEVGDDPPAALKNVAALAGLDLAALKQSIEDGDHGSVRLRREEANTRLSRVFEESYGQSDVRLQLDTDGSLLRLLVRAEGGEDFVELSERSAGFQWFVALVAFLAHSEYERPIVLIDEIETHLHYSAQADVIDVLTRQKVSKQIIYTTHSAGALPPDLGQGVRAVVPVLGRQRSEINNSFWTSGPGFTPLLFSLGASTLAFSIPKYLIVAEGASDSVLLPTLIRQANDLEELPYRIAPGIAQYSTGRSE